MALGMVREALRLFQREHPQTRLRISTLRGRARIEGVSNGSLDLAIVSHDEPSIAEIARRPLHVEPLVSHGLALVCAQDSPWIRAVRALPKDAVPARALTEFPLIVPEPDAGIRKDIDRGSASRRASEQAEHRPGSWVAGPRSWHMFGMASGSAWSVRGP